MRPASRCWVSNGCIWTLCNVCSQYAPSRQVSIPSFSLILNTKLLSQSCYTDEWTDVISMGAVTWTLFCFIWRPAVGRLLRDDTTKSAAIFWKNRDLWEFLWLLWPWNIYDMLSPFYTWRSCRNCTIQVGWSSGCEERYTKSENNSKTRKRSRRTFCSRRYVYKEQEIYCLWWKSSISHARKLQSHYDQISNLHCSCCSSEYKIYALCDKINSWTAARKLSLRGCKHSKYSRLIV